MEVNSVNGASNNLASVKQTEESSRQIIELGEELKNVENEEEEEKKDETPGLEGLDFNANNQEGGEKEGKGTIIDTLA